MPTALISEETLQILEARGNVLVKVYRDLISRRKAMASKIETFKKEYERTQSKVTQVQEDIDKAEKSRRAYQSQELKRKVGKGGAPVDSRVEKLHKEAIELRVEIEALRSTKVGDKLCNLVDGDPGLEGS